jgi:hypothetical protein
MIFYRKAKKVSAKNSLFLGKGWICYLLFYCFFFQLPLQSITVDLREPTFSEGILKTEKGGVITAPNIRIQAQKIIYSKVENDGTCLVFLEAEDDLIVEFGEYVFVGRRLEYDFETKKGILYDGRTAVEPWFFGGKEIHLCPDGSYLIYEGFATTSENYKTEWRIETDEASLVDHRILTARNVNLRIFNVPLLWMPRFRINLDTIFNSPFRYTVRFGGTQGPRIGVSYDAFTWRGLKTRIMLDYRLKRGWGGGAEFDYKSPTNFGHFHAINYIAKDTTIYNRKPKTRYRYQGLYTNSLDCGKTTLLGSYDILSDKDMATDYDDKGLQLETAKPTQIEIRRQESNWIVDLLARFRVNSFQTVKQELPTLSGSLRPFVLGNTGIISENRFKFSYLELEFTDDRPDGKNFNSPRYELFHSFYRPYSWNVLNITPQAGVLAIYYGNNPDKFERWMTIGLFECEVNTNLYRFYGNCKHAISPYANYQYFTYPTTFPNDHYIFDIDDGWYRLNMLRLGVNNNFYTKTCDGCIYRKLYTDFFIYGFFDTETLPYEVPKAYTKVVYNVTPFLRHTMVGAWDIQRNMLDHWNYELQWTVNNNTAVAAEYRHRSPYDWRKADHTNFILDSFREAEELRFSELSDRRDTFLLHFYHRFHPNWALEFQSRKGWDRTDEPSYFEFEVDLLGTFRSYWHLRISYRHRTDDDRISFNFSIGLRRPDDYDPNCVPCLEF